MIGMDKTVRATTRAILAITIVETKLRVDHFIHTTGVASLISC